VKAVPQLLVSHLSAFRRSKQSPYPSLPPSLPPSLLQLWLQCHRVFLRVGRVTQRGEQGKEVV